MKEFHGKSNTRLYSIWKHMRQRCYNSNKDSYINYGARGITICDEWLESFTSFETWALQNGYSDELTIDRIDVDGNYEPDNCRWTDLTTQAANTRKLHKHNKSGYRGVSWQPKMKKWEVSIPKRIQHMKNSWFSQINKKKLRIWSGYFSTAEEAAYQRDKYIRENNIESKLNFSDENYALWEEIQKTIRNQ